MKKVRVLQIIFAIVQVVALIPLTIEIFGDMNPDVISASAIVVGIGICGNVICAIIRTFQEPKKK